MASRAELVKRRRKCHECGAVSYLDTHGGKCNSCEAIFPESPQAQAQRRFKAAQQAAQRGPGTPYLDLTRPPGSAAAQQQDFSAFQLQNAQANAMFGYGVTGGCWPLSGAIGGYGNGQW